MGVVANIVDLAFHAVARAFLGPKIKRGVLLVSSGGLGDTILFSLVAPRFAKLAAAGEPVHLIVRAENAGAAFLFDPSIEVTPISYRKFIRNPVYRFRIMSRLRRFGYRLAVSCDHLRLPTVDDTFVAAASPAQAFALEPRSWPKHDARLRANRRFYTRWIVPSSGMAHRAVRWTELSNALLGRNDPPPVVRLPEDRLPPPAVRPRPTVVLHPFSTTRERQHSVDRFREIARAIPPDCDVVLSAGPGDLAGNPDFFALLNLPNVILDEGKTLREKAALLRSACLVVAADTSIMHLAVGVGAPTLCLASAAHVVDSVPYGSEMIPSNAHFLYYDMPCRGCLGACIHPLENGMYPCVARMDTRMAVREALRIFTAAC